MKKFLLLAFAYSITIFLWGQSGGKTILKLPAVFDKPYDSLNVNMESGNSQNSQNWFVYSDRKNNKTYATPGSSSVLKSIDFLDLFYVVAEHNDYVNIYKDVNPGSETSGSAENCGWIRKENLIIWHKALYNDREIQRKAMVLNTIEAVKKTLAQGEGTRVKFYDDPTLGNANDKVANIYTIFYIYKFYPNASTPTSVLLGTKTLINAFGINEDIWGWVSYAKVTSWDHRVAVLPNTNEDAIGERKNAQVKATVLCDESEARLFKDRKKVDPNCIFWNKDNYYKSSDYSGYYMRYPVLDNEKNIGQKKGVMKIGFMGDLEAKVAGKTDTIDPRRLAYLMKLINDLQAKTRQINIIFVIDGTSSMGPFYPKISEAVINSIKTLGADKKNTFRFGALIYRDYDEGKRIIEVLKLTADEQEISNRLRKVHAFDSLDRSPEEAVYYGLKEAMTTFNLPPDQTNNIFLIGDAGNHKRNDPSQVPIDDLVNLIVKYDYNFFAFQANNKGTPTYYEFVSQAKEIIFRAANERYQKLLIEPNPLHWKLTPPSKAMPVDAARQRFYLEQPYIYGAVYYCNANKSIPPDLLKAKLVNEVHSINDSINRMLSKLNCIVNGGCTMNKDSLDAPFIKYLVSVGMPIENIPTILNEHYQIYSRGYTSVITAGLKYPIWEHQLFFNAEELHDLNKGSRVLGEASTSEARRAKFQLYWERLLSSHIGGHEDDDNPYLEDIERKKFGLPGTSDLLKQIRLKDIPDKAKLSDDQLERWIDKILSNTRKLEKIYNRNEAFKEYWWSTNDEYYYWIPQTFLP